MSRPWREKARRASRAMRWSASGRELVEGLENDGFRAEARPDAAEFQPDGAGPDDPEARGHRFELKSPGRVHDDTRYQWRRLDVDRYGPRRQDDVVGFEHGRLAVVGRVLDAPVPQQAPASGQRRDAVAVEQRSDTSGEPCDHRVLARHHRGHVDRDRPHLDAEFAEVPARLAVLVRHVEQRLGGNAAPVEARAPEGGLAVPIEGLVYARRAHPELRRAYGRGIAGGSRADHDHFPAGVVLSGVLVHRPSLYMAASGRMDHQSSSRIRAGSSMSAFTVTRNRTASWPSISRWS